MRRPVNLVLIFLIFCLVAFATAVQPGAAGAAAQAKKTEARPAAVKNPVPSTPQSIATGKALFAKYCRFCHGDEAKGDGPQAPEGTHPPDLTDDKWDHGPSDADIFGVIKDGVGPKYDMKGYNSKMTPQEMWSVVNFLRSIGPKGKSH